MASAYTLLVCLQVTGLTFSDDGNTFVTVGTRHVKFWYLDANKSRVKETVPLMGRSGILGEQKNNFFCGAAFGHGVFASSTYVITQSGLLCEFNEKRLLDKWVELRVSVRMFVYGSASIPHVNKYGSTHKSETGFSCQLHDISFVRGGYCCQKL